MTLDTARTAPTRPAAIASSSSVAADLAYCREVLPRVSRTFALNIRLLSGSMVEAVRIAYLMCRISDTIEDSWPGDRAEVERRFDQLLAALAGDGDAARGLASAAAALRPVADPAHAELVSRTPDVLRAFSTLDRGDRDDVTSAVTTMAQGMRRYAGRAAERRAAAGGATMGAGGAMSGGGAMGAAFPYLDDDEELGDYCWIVAGCVGVMLTRLYARRAGPTGADRLRLELAPAVGEGLQLTNILLDWPSDMRGGRCHVPASWLAEQGLTPRDLVGTDRPEIRVLAQRLETRARWALERVPDYLATIPSRHVRYRMFCLWPSLWARASLRHAQRVPEFPWGATRPRLPKAELWRVAGAALVRGHSEPGVRGLFEMRPR